MSGMRSHGDRLTRLEQDLSSFLQEASQFDQVESLGRVEREAMEKSVAWERRFDESHQEPLHKPPRTATLAATSTVIATERRDHLVKHNIGIRALLSVAMSSMRSHGDRLTRLEQDLSSFLQEASQFDQVESLGRVEREAMERSCVLAQINAVREERSRINCLLSFGPSEQPTRAAPQAAQDGDSRSNQHSYCHVALSVAGRRGVWSDVVLETRPV
ncbi:hypothetical protein ACLOJK_002740 [Asimina triloba]